MDQLLQENTIETIHYAHFLWTWLTILTSSRLNLIGQGWVTCLTIFQEESRDLYYWHK